MADIVLHEVSRNLGEGDYVVQSEREPGGYYWEQQGRYETEGEARARANFLVQEKGHWVARVVHERMSKDEGGTE